MSFYGNALYQVVRSFAEARLKTGATDSVETSSPTPANLTIEAENRAGQIGFASGNKWIGLDKKTIDGVETITFHHEQQENDGNEITILNNLGQKDAEPEGCIELNYDDILEITSFAYDTFGHVCKEQKTTTFKMPSQPALSDELDKLKEVDESYNKRLETLESFDQEQVEINKTIDSFDGRIETAEGLVSTLDEKVNGFETDITNVNNKNSCQDSFISVIDSNVGYDSENKISSGELVSFLQSAPKDASTGKNSLISVVGSYDKDLDEELRSKTILAAINAAYSQAVSASGNAGAANNQINSLIKRIEALEEEVEKLKNPTQE